VEGTRPRRRPKKTWREIVEKDCRARGLNTEDAMDRSTWRKQTGMIDDHNECEWVNVSSVPAHLGCPGQIPQSCKTVVCVCLCQHSERSAYVMDLLPRPSVCVCVCPESVLWQNG